MLAYTVMDNNNQIQYNVNFGVLLITVSIFLKGVWVQDYNTVCYGSLHCDSHTVQISGNMAMAS